MSGTDANPEQTHQFLMRMLSISVKNFKFEKVPLKVHKNENFFGSDFEFRTISLLVVLKLRFCKKIFFDQATIGGRFDYST